MDALITRIIEIEKQSARDIELAEQTCRNHIEAHQRALEDKKEEEHTRISAAEHTRLTQNLEELKRRTEAASLASARAFEARFHNPAFIEAVKEKIITILLNP